MADATDASHETTESCRTRCMADHGLRCHVVIVSSNRCVSHAERKGACDSARSDTTSFPSELHPSDG